MTRRVAIAAAIALCAAGATAGCGVGAGAPNDGGPDGDGGDNDLGDAVEQSPDSPDSPDSSDAPDGPPAEAGCPGGPLIAGLVTDGTTVYADPVLPKPGYLAPMLLSPWFTTLLRIADDPGAGFTALDGSTGTWGADARHHYQKDQPWSADCSLIALQNEAGGSPSVVYLDGETYAVVSGLCSSYSLGDDRWHPSPAHPHERINVSGATADWYDVVACAETRTFRLPFAVNYFGMGEGNPSFDGRYAALSDGVQVFVLDMDPQPPLAPYPNYRVGPARDMTDCALAPNAGCTIDWVSVSPSGAYVVVVYDGDYPRVFDVDPATLALSPRAMPMAYPNCAGDPALGFVYNLGHADMTLDPFDSNEDVLVGQEHCGNSGSTIAGMLMGGVAMTRLRDGAVTSLTDPTNEAYPHHVSTRSYDRPGWAYVSYYPASGQRFDDEIVAVSLDGSLAVERLANMHSDFSGCYRCETHAVPSRDGRRVLFASDWMIACGAGCGTQSSIQGYVIDARGP